MEQKRFPLLTADDIMARVQSASLFGGEAKAHVLLYKDARVDMRLLDEAFGPMNWQRKHEIIGGNLYCTIEVWDSEKGCWVGKSDVGTESNTEAEKGQSSDSFKRAGFNWGIGRELYTAPQISIPLGEKEYTPDGRKAKVNAGVRFYVKAIGYNERNEINSLIITDRWGKVRYTYPAETEKTAPPKKAPAKPKQNTAKNPPDSPDNATENGGGMNTRPPTRTEAEKAAFEELQMTWASTNYKPEILWPWILKKSAEMGREIDAGFYNELNQQIIEIEIAKEQSK